LGSVARSASLHSSHRCSSIPSFVPAGGDPRLPHGDAVWQVEEGPSIISRTLSDTDSSAFGNPLRCSRGRSPKWLPIGVQIVGRPCEESGGGGAAALRSSGAGKIPPTCVRLPVLASSMMCTNVPITRYVSKLNSRRFPSLWDRGPHHSRGLRPIAKNSRSEVSAGPALSWLLPLVSHAPCLSLTCPQANIFYAAFCAMARLGGVSTALLLIPALSRRAGREALLRGRAVC